MQVCSWKEVTRLVLQCHVISPEYIIKLIVMAVLQSISLAYIVVLLRCGETSQGYDPTGRIYPWPLPPDKKPLFFSLIVSFGETFNSSGVVPGVNVALDIINSNDNNLLSGYSLHYILSDSQVRLNDSS